MPYCSRTVIIGNAQIHGTDSRLAESTHILHYHRIFQELGPIDKIEHVKDAGGKILPGTGIITCIITCVKCKEESRQLSY